MGIKGLNIGAKLRIYMIKEALKNEFGDHATVTFDGRRFVVNAKEIAANDGKIKIDVKNTSKSAFPILTCPDQELEDKIEVFVYETVKEMKTQVKRSIADRVIDDFYWKY